MRVAGRVMFRRAVLVMTPTRVAVVRGRSLRRCLRLSAPWLRSWVPNPVELWSPLTVSALRLLCIARTVPILTAVTFRARSALFCLRMTRCVVIPLLMSRYGTLSVGPLIVMMVRAIRSVSRPVSLVTLSAVPMRMFRVRRAWRVPFVVRIPRPSLRSSVCPLSVCCRLMLRCVSARAPSPRVPP